MNRLDLQYPVQVPQSGHTRSHTDRHTHKAILVARVGYDSSIQKSPGGILAGKDVAIDELNQELEVIRK